MLGLTCQNDVIWNCRFKDTMNYHEDVMHQLELDNAAVELLPILETRGQRRAASGVFRISVRRSPHRHRARWLCSRGLTKPGHTIGSSVFFWNCTRRTLVTFSNSGSVSSSSSGGGAVVRPLTGGGDARRDSSPYTSRATTSCAWSRAWNNRFEVIEGQRVMQIQE